MKKFKRIEGHYIYQLRERIPFTPKEDPIVAKLLTEIGDLQAYTYSVLNAYKSYHLALKFSPNNEMIMRKITELETLDSSLRLDNQHVKAFLRDFD